MVKSFINSFFGGFGRTFGKIIAYLIIGLIFFLIYDNAHAEELNINSSIYGDTGYNNMYWGQNYYNGSLSNSNFSFNTRYSGRLALFVFDVKRSFVANTTYTMYVYAPTTDFRNTLAGVIIDDITNSSSCTTINAQFVSKTKLKASFACGLNTNRISMMWYANEGSYLTGDSNFNINKVTLETQTTSGSNNDDIINNATENTQDIINNNNSNTQDVINNQNQNTQDIINNQNQNSSDIQDSINSSCKTGPYVLEGAFVGEDNKYLDSSGTLVTSSSSYVTNYISVIPSSSYTLTYNDDIPNYYYVCTYLNNKNLHSCFVLHGGGNGALYSHTFTLNNFISYIRVSVRKSRRMTLTGPVCNDWAFEQQQEINNFLNDKSEGDTSIFSTWWSNFNPGSNPLGNVITLPIRLVEKFVTFNSSSCQPVNLGSLLGTDLVLPCFTLYSVLPDNASTLINVVDTIMCVAILVIIIKNAYETIANLISLGGENKVKAHFRIPTPLEFLAGVLNGDGYSEYVSYR